MKIVVEAYSIMKATVKRIKPVYSVLVSLKIALSSKDQIAWLVRLIGENRSAVLRPCCGMKDTDAGLEFLHETVKDFLEHYRIIKMKRKVKDRPEIPDGAVLIYNPLALIRIPLRHEEYLSAIGAKTRNMIRKAEKQGYEFRHFEWNKHLEAIFDINTSKEVRSAGKMHGWYLDPVMPLHPSKDNPLYLKHYGVFQGDQLCAYLNLVLCGDFAYFKDFIGHADHLKNGIMNYLVSCTIRECIAFSYIKWLNYGWYAPVKSNGGSVMGFKKHTGFEAYASFLDLENDQKLLQYADKIWIKDLR